MKTDSFIRDVLESLRSLDGKDCAAEFCRRLRKVCRQSAKSFLDRTGIDAIKKEIKYLFSYSLALERKYISSANAGIAERDCLLFTRSELAEKVLRGEAGREEREKWNRERSRLIKRLRARVLEAENAVTGLTRAAAEWREAFAGRDADDAVLAAFSVLLKTVNSLMGELEIPGNAVPGLEGVRLGAVPFGRRFMLAAAACAECEGAGNINLSIEAGVMPQLRELSDLLSACRAALAACAEDAGPESGGARREVAAGCV